MGLAIAFVGVITFAIVWIMVALLIELNARK